MKKKKSAYFIKIIKKKKFLKDLSKLKTRRLGRFLLSPTVKAQNFFQNSQFSDISKIVFLGYDKYLNHY